MTYLGDIWLQHEIDDERIAEVVAKAFGVASVSVWPALGVADPAADLIVQREHQAGDFPWHLSFSAPAGSSLEELTGARLQNVFRVMARELNLAILTEIDTLFDDDFTLIMPAGETFRVSIAEEPASDGRLVLTPESHQRWKAALAHVAAAD